MFHHTQLYKFQKHFQVHCLQDITILNLIYKEVRLTEVFYAKGSTEEFKQMYTLIYLSQCLTQGR